MFRSLREPLFTPIRLTRCAPKAHGPLPSGERGNLSVPRRSRDTFPRESSSPSIPSIPRRGGGRSFECRPIFCGRSNERPPRRFRGPLARNFVPSRLPELLPARPPRRTGKASGRRTLSQVTRQTAVSRRPGQGSSLPYGCEPHGGHHVRRHRAAISHRDPLRKLVATGWRPFVERGRGDYRGGLGSGDKLFSSRDDAATSGGDRRRCPKVS